MTWNRNGRSVSWSPIGQGLIKKLAGKDNIRLIICPFIQSETVSQILKYCHKNEGMKVITRWRPGDISTGFSDIDVFNLLSEKGIPLYINDRIHLKLFVSDANSCFVGSANITKAGLGYSKNYNLEAGVWVHLGLGDWLEIYSIINNCRLVDEATYKKAQQYLDQNLYRPPPLPPLIFPELPNKEFSLSSLPAVKTPEILLRFCTDYNNNKYESTEEDLNRLYHDLSLFELHTFTSKEKLSETLKQSFRSHLFIKAIVEHLQERKSMRFGEVSEWIHRKCTDVPVPYRWEVKPSIKILYNWLDFFFNEIEWNIPGKHSQVIYWRE